MKLSQAYELYPLPESEQRELVRASVLSEAILTGVAVVAAIALHGLSTGDWLRAPVAWIADVAAHLTPSWAMIVLPILMVGAMCLFDYLGSKTSAAYRKARHELVQGITGELPRIPYPHMVLCMALAGICEELLFRYCLIGLLMLGLTQLLPTAAATVLAVLVSTVLFVAIHAQYRDPWSISLTTMGALFLGTAYVLTGSLLTVMFAHAAYNMATLLIEQYHMVVDPDYFGGPAPTNACAELAGQANPQGETEGE